MVFLRKYFLVVWGAVMLSGFGYGFPVFAQNFKLTVERPTATNDGAIKGGKVKSDCEKVAGNDSGKIAIVLVRSKTYDAGGYGCSSSSGNWVDESDSLDTFKNYASLGGTAIDALDKSDSSNFGVYRSNKIDETNDGSVLCVDETKGKSVYYFFVLKGGTGPSNAAGWGGKGDHEAWGCVGANSPQLVVAHETLGHNFAFLMDEYFTESVKGSPSPDAPYYNCTAASSCEKWKNASFPGGTLVESCTEGCFNESNHWYRSSDVSVMRANGVVFPKLHKFIINAYVQKTVNGIPLPDSIRKMGSAL